MPTFTTEGIILKRSDFSEADRILTILTPFRGKIKVLAKGVRRITSRRGGNVELLNKVRVQLFVGKGLAILTEAESLKTYPKIKSNLTVMTYASHVTELADKLLAENQINNGAYKLLSIILDLLETHPRQIFIRAYEVKLLNELGFWAASQIEANDRVKQLLRKLEVGSWEEISKLKLDEGESVELGKILRYYMERVIESKLKSLEIVRKLKNG